ncbi:hypothetical protein GW17_00016524 [Ensete ventricosum]|nr:hypothetical protein GW17_00016524 [Ensete ventricosum]
MEWEPPSRSPHLLGRPARNWPISDPTKFQQGESSERPPDKEEQASDVMQPCMRVDFPRWEEGDLTGWLLRAERYFHYHRTPEAFMRRRSMSMRRRSRRKNNSRRLYDACSYQLREPVYDESGRTT